jgi:cell division protein FtsB
MIINNTLILTPPFLRIFKVNLSLKFLWFFMLLIIFSLLIVCIFQLNAYTKEFYLIQDYEKKLNQLTQENKILEINFSKANSLSKIGSYIQSQAFEKAEKVEYIQLLEGTALAK